MIVFQRKKKVCLYKLKGPAVDLLLFSLWKEMGKLLLIISWNEDTECGMGCADNIWMKLSSYMSYENHNRRKKVAIIAYTDLWIFKMYKNLQNNRLCYLTNDSILPKFILSLSTQSCLNSLWHHMNCLAADFLSITTCEA